MSTSANLHVAWVAGATGYTGREVVRLLVEQGHSSYAHIRPDSPQRARWETHFTNLGAHADTTPWELDALCQRLTHLAPTQVYFLIGTTQARTRQAMRQGEASADYEHIDYGLASLLLRACVKANIKPRWVYLSSLGVGPRARGRYLQVRYRFEQELIASGLPYTIARPSFITGTDRDEFRPLERSFARLTDAVGAIPKALGFPHFYNRYASLTNTELARALVRLANDPSKANTICESDQLRSSI